MKKYGESISFKLTDDLFEMLKKEANALSVGLGTRVRMILNEYYKNEKQED